MFLGDFFAQTLKPFKKGFRAQELSGFGPKGLAQRRGGPHDCSFLVGRKFGFNLFDYRYADAIQLCMQLKRFSHCSCSHLPFLEHGCDAPARLHQMEPWPYLKALWFSSSKEIMVDASEDCQSCYR